jgi:hyperosmotically inducible periplasmic protein
MNRIAVALILLVGACGCNRQDAEKLTRVGWKVTEKVQALVPNRTPWGSAWGVMPDLGVDGRVRARLQADKHLASFNVEVMAVDRGVRLRGRIGDEAMKQRAIEMAQSTLGVEKVVDELE